MVKYHTRFRSFRGNAIISRAEHPHHRLIPWLKCVAVFGILFPAAPIAHALNVGGTITTTTTWHLSDSPVIVTSDVTVNGVQLSIEPGVVVKYNVGLNIVFNNGALIAPGTIANPIYFTSINDNSVGGVASGSTGSPAPGDWQFAQLNNSSATLANVRIRYGGRIVPPAFTTLSAINGSTITFNGGDVSFSQFDGIEEDGNSVLSISSVNFIGNGQWAVNANGLLPALTGSTFASDVNGVLIAAPQSVQFNGNVFQSMSNVAMQLDPGVQLLNTQDDVVVPIASGPMHVNLVPATGNVSNPVTWALADRMPYVVATNNIAFLPGAMLTIPAGGIVKLFTLSLSLQGGLTAVGTPTKPITFTSFKDDSVGGDTNEDGGATIPSPGDWNIGASLESSFLLSKIIGT